MKNKFATAALSVAIAFALWLFVITTVSPGSKETYSNIPVVLANESVLTERGLIITSNQNNVVTMVLSGNRTDLSKVDQSNITLKADLSTIYEPGNRIPLTYTTTFPGNVASNAFVIESKNPGRIFVNVEYRDSKFIPVEVRWTGAVPEGFIADRENKLLEYDTVQIIGPRSVVEKIEKAVIDVDLTDQRESISQDYLYTLCDAEGEPVDAELIKTNTEQIHLDVKIQRFKEIQLTYILVEDGGARASDAEVQLSAEKIRVSGSEAALEMMGDQFVLGVINLAEVVSDTMEKTFVIALEEGITNMTGVTEVTATVTLRGLATKTFTIRDIQVQNVPEELEVDLITQELALTVRGPAEQIERLDMKDLIVSVDFANAEIGNFTFPVRVDYAEGFDAIGILKADSVSASVIAAGTRATETTTEPEAPTAEAVG